MGGKIGAAVTPPPPKFGRNLSAVLLWELLWGFGAACTSSSIFVPFLTQLTGSKRAVGIAGLSTLLGIPALVVSLWVNHRLRRRKLAVALLWIVQVVGWIVLGALVVSGAYSTFAILLVVYVMQALSAFLSGVSMAPTYQLLTTCFGSRFGTAQGLQLLIRQISGMAGGVWAASMLDRWAAPKSFGITLLVGGVVLTASNIALLAFWEQPSIAPKESTAGYLRSFHKTIIGATGFSRFILVVVLVAWPTSVQGFLAVSAIERLSLSNAYAGIFTTVALAAQGIGGAIAGRLGDAIDHRRAMAGALFLQAISFVLVMKIGSIEQFYVGLALSAAASAATQIGLAGVTAKLAPESERGAFMAVERWITLIAMALGTLGAAFLADATSYTIFFLVSLVPLSVAIVILRRV